MGWTSSLAIIVLYEHMTDIYMAMKVCMCVIIGEGAMQAETLSGVYKYDLV